MPYSIFRSLPFHFQDFVGMCLSARPIVLYYISSELEKERFKPLTYKSPFVQSPIQTIRTV